MVLKSLKLSHYFTTLRSQSHSKKKTTLLFQKNEKCASCVSIGKNRLNIENLAASKQKPV